MWNINCDGFIIPKKQVSISTGGLVLREVVMGNGSLLVNFDRELNLRDLYWPYGGFENHGDGNRTSFAVFVENRLSWLFENSWQREVGYIEDTPVTRIHASNSELRVELFICDAVHPTEDFYLKQVTVGTVLAMLGT